MSGEKSRQFASEGGEEGTAVLLPDGIAPVTSGFRLAFRFRTEKSQSPDRAVEKLMLLIYFGMTGEIDRLHIQNWMGWSFPSD